MYPFYLELELIKPVSNYFKNQGYNIRYEVKIGFCRADILAFKKDKVVAIELKLKDWKKAIIQLKNYQLGADFVYLAVPLFRVYSILRKAKHILEKDGIGLLVITEENCEVRKIIDPKPSQKKFCSISIGEIKQNNYKKRGL